MSNTLFRQVEAELNQTYFERREEILQQQAKAVEALEAEAALSALK